MAQAAPFSVSRVLDAPRPLVFAVHTDPAHLATWMSPEGFETIHADQDFRVGGSYHYGLRGPGGAEMWGRQRYREIVPDERLVFMQSFSDRDGGLTRHPMAATWPLEILAAATFDEAGADRTHLTVTWRPHEADDAANVTFDAAREGMRHGFAGTFAKLEAYLAKLQA